MHETYRMMAQNRIEERLREAAEWHRADALRRDRSWRPASIAARVRRLGHRRRAGQRAAAGAVLATDRPAGTSA